MQVFAFMLTLLSFARCCNLEQTLGHVVFANVLYSNGDRTPIEPYPNDPYKNESLWPVPFGHLTNIGSSQQVKLGKWLRDRYPHLLSLKYLEHDIYVLSTDANSTLTSAEANLIGMYPQSWAQGDIQRWMIPTVSEKEDNVISGKRFCERYSRELKRVRASSEMKKIDEINEELYEFLSVETGKKISSLEDVGLLYDTLFVEELHNKTLPTWTKYVYPNRLKPLAEKNFAMPAYNKLLQRLKTGPLLKEIIQRTKLKSKYTLAPNRNLWIYSVHDYTIANMLNTLGVFEPHCPPYASALLIELRLKARNNYVVTIFYKKSAGEPILLTVPGCSAACPLNQFVKLTEDVIPGHWGFECSFEYEDYIAKEAEKAIFHKSDSYLLFFLLILMVFLLKISLSHNVNYFKDFILVLEGFVFFYLIIYINSPDFYW